MRVALKLCSEKELASGARSEFRLRGRKQAVALRLLACDLARPPNGFRPFADLSLRRLLIGSALPQFAKDAFALHLLLEDSHRLIDIVIAHHDQQYNLPSVDCQIKRLCQSLPPVAIPRKPRGERSDGSAPQAASASTSVVAGLASVPVVSGGLEPVCGHLAPTGGPVSARS
jgi:hypothetical protein